MKNKTVRFRIKEKFCGSTYYNIQKKHWFGWCKYDTVNYWELEIAITRLKEINDNYPNIHPIQSNVIAEIEVES